MLNIIRLNFLGKSNFTEKLTKKLKGKGLLVSFLIGVIFAFGTGVPVVLFTYLLAFAAGNIGIFYAKITKIEKVMRSIACVVFILTGLYYVFIFTGVI